MVLEQPKQLEVKKIGDLNEGLTAGIDESSLPFVFELVSKQLYSNPIGSLIREYTSNCFDSHIEAEVDEPVIINQVYSVEEGYAIEFIDVGVGLSPDRIIRIFMNYFSSTKRETNNQIGGFGIGSKTGLAYDGCNGMFYITTIFDGLMYEYLYHKGEVKPTLESLYGYNEYPIEVPIIVTDEVTGEEIIEYEYRIQKVPIGVPTEERNGTTIKINIDKEDLAKFKEELKFQLAYFDNVYFTKWGINNDYDIYEGEYYKFRSDIPQNDGSYYNSTKGAEIHLCIGKVRYPIDFTKVNIPQEYRNIPIAVKFDIGELQITPSRETLRYTPEGIKLIQERIKLATNEVVEIFNKQNPIIENLKDYVDVIDSKPKITFDKSKNHVLYLWDKSKIERNFKFRPLVDLGIKKTPRELFFMWERIATISPVGIRHTRYETDEVTNHFILDNHYIIAGKDDRASTYTDLKISKEDFPNGVTVIRRKTLDYKEITKSLGIKEAKTLGKAKTIRSYLKAIDKIVLDKGTQYADLRATDEWIAEYKRSIKESTAAFIRKKNKKVFVRDAGRAFKGVDLSVDELSRRTGILVYGYKEDQNILNKIFETVISNKQSIVKAHRKEDRDKAFMVIQVAKSSEKDIIPEIVFDKKGKVVPNKTKVIYWKDFLKTKFFRKIETSYYIYQELNNLNLNNTYIREKLLYKFKEDYNAVVASHSDYQRYSYSYRHNFSFSVYEELLSKNYIQDMLVPLNKFKAKHVFKIPKLIEKLDKYMSDELQEEAIEYLKYKGFKLKTQFYLKDKRKLEYEKNLIQILKQFKEPKQLLLLTYTLNQTENGNEESNNT